jgi:hypothetical protein
MHATRRQTMQPVMACLGGSVSHDSPPEWKSLGLIEERIDLASATLPDRGFTKLAGIARFRRARQRGRALT